MNYRRHPSTMAFDRTASVRSYDADGHLRISDAILTGQGVSEYYGSEIPNADALGLDPNRLYPLLRPAAELKAAASTLAGKPILAGHVSISSDDHPHNRVVGAVGTDVHFDGQFVRGSLMIWPADSIRAIESDEIRDLSAGYYYTCQLQSGSLNGTRYVGVMTGIQFQHLALVPEGRFEMAMVGDARPRFRSTSTSRLLVMDDDNNDDFVTQLMKFLNDKISPEDLSTVGTILSNGMGGIVGDTPPNTQGAPMPPNVAGAPRLNPITRGAMDTARARSEFARLFPDAPKLRRY